MSMSAAQLRLVTRGTRSSWAIAPKSDYPACSVAGAAVSAGPLRN